MNSHPPYRLGGRVAKFRKLPRPLTPEQRIEYSKAITEEVLKRQRASILLQPEQIRRQRRPEEWAALYAEAMKLKQTAAGADTPGNPEPEKLTCQC